MTLHSRVHYKEISARTCSGLLFSSVNESTPMHKVVCGTATSGSIPQRLSEEDELREEEE